MVCTESASSNAWCDQASVQTVEMARQHLCCENRRCGRLPREAFWASLGKETNSNIGTARISMRQGPCKTTNQLQRIKGLGTVCQIPQLLKILWSIVLNSENVWSSTHYGYCLCEVIKETDLYPKGEPILVMFRLA
jgi:hypothetical protein